MCGPVILKLEPAGDHYATATGFDLTKVVRVEFQGPTGR